MWSFNTIDEISYEIQGWKSRLIGQIHDAIVMDVHPDELDMVVEVVKRVTCEDLPKAWPWIVVPLAVEVEICEVNASWDKKKEYEK